jgi:CoA:oxalate CoA-transferase
MLLADMGAEVIRVGPPAGSEDRNLGTFCPDGQALVYGLILQRNKKNITLNLRSAEARDLLERLVKKTDVLVHNFPPGTEEATVLDYNALKQINPALIEVIITGFGQYGPYAQRTCFDSIAQAMSGAMSYTGFPGSPPTRAGVQYVDFSTGLSAALGTTLALLYRQKTGKGQLVDVSLFDVAFSFVAAAGVAAEYKLLGEIRPQVGNNSFYAYANSFRAKDGWVMVNVVGDSAWRRFCRALGREDLTHDPRFKDNLSRYLNRDEIHPIVADRMKEKTVAQVTSILESARVPCGHIRNMADIYNDPQVAAREMLLEIEQPDAGKVPMPGIPIKLSHAPGSIEAPAPKLGQHNSEIYCQLVGLTEQQLAGYRQKGVI